MKQKIKLVKNYGILYAFIGIFAVLSIYFGIYPLVQSIFISFTDTSTIFTGVEFVWFDNYIEIFKDEYFWNSLRLTLTYTVASVALNMVVALCFAQLLSYKHLKIGKLFFKLAIFIPVITPDVVGAVVWKQFFNSNGALNQVLGLFGIAPVEWLTNSTIAVLVLMFIELWKHVGLYTIIFLTNYQLIDRTMYEAADIDGATAWQSYIYITLPSLRPAIVLNVVYGFIQFMKTYTVARIITFGGPNYSTNFLSYYAYSKYESLNFGSATAIATVLFLIIIAITMVGLKLGGKQDEN